MLTLCERAGERRAVEEDDDNEEEAVHDGRAHVLVAIADTHKGRAWGAKEGETKPQSKGRFTRPLLSLID